MSSSVFLLYILLSLFLFSRSRARVLFWYFFYFVAAFFLIFLYCIYIYILHSLLLCGRTAPRHTLCMHYRASVAVVVMHQRRIPSLFFVVFVISSLPSHIPPDRLKWMVSARLEDVFARALPFKCIAIYCELGKYPAAAATNKQTTTTIWIDVLCPGLPCVSDVKEYEAQMQKE